VHNITNPEQHGFWQRLVDVERSFQSVFVANVEAELDFFLDAVLQYRRRRQHIAPGRRVDVVKPVGGPAAAVVDAAAVMVSAEGELQAVGVDVVVDDRSSQTAVLRYLGDGARQTRRLTGRLQSTTRITRTRHAKPICKERTE